ncbi:Leucine-Rich Repeat-Containing Protein 14 [Manis pentadactyla]|nr:Leucine-Rich Repeat-Containing Protein 14 [Manis pentadactyla]
MDQKTTGTLLELAAKSLLSNELAAIHALDELPRALFVPLFIPAFVGRHKEILKAMNSTLRTEEAQHSVRCRGFDNSESEPHSALETVELLVDLSLDGTLRTQQFLSFLQSKVRQSSGSLHLCCRDLVIDNISAHRSMLQFLDPRCIDHLQVNQAYLRKVNHLVAQTAHLYSLRHPNIIFTYFVGRHFQTFLNGLGKLNSLQELELSALFLGDRLQRLLRVLPPQLKTLNLPFCSLSSIDVTILSQSSQATHLRQLNLSHNQIFSEAYEPFQTLLERASGTLQHLEINNCLLSDSTLSALLPALSHCSCLRVLSFAFNPITMPVLTRLLRHLTSLRELKHVIYPIPVHCYRQWDVRDSLDRRQLAEVQAQLKAMLQAVERDDMLWTTHSA